jgi:lysophospholipase
MSIHHYLGHHHQGHRFLALILLLVVPMVNAAAPSTTATVWSSEKAYPDKEIMTTWDAARTGEFTGVDNVKIRFRIFENSPPNPKEKNAIVIVNGRSESMAKYRELIYDLRQHGFAVYAYDQRGLGYSGRMQDDPQKGHVQDFDDYAADLNTFVETQVKPDGHPRLFLLSHSMGGAMSSLYLANYAHPFKAAALASPMHEFYSGPLGVGCGIAAPLNAMDGVFGDQSAYAPGTGKYKADPFADNVYTTSETRYIIFRAAFEQEPALQIGGPTVRWASEACDGAKRSREKTASIAIPILVLQSGNDRVVTAKGQQEFCANLAAGGKSQCETGMPVIIEGAEHELFIERDAIRNQALDKIINFYTKTR